MDNQDVAEQDERIVVNAANSWNQAKGKDAKCKREASEIPFTTVVPLLNLNDDCVRHIASYLQLDDLINLSKTCQSLECSLEPIFASYKKLCIDSFHSLSLLKHEVLSKIGPHFRLISWRINYEETLFPEVLERYCVAGNIVSIDFNYGIPVSKALKRKHIYNITDNMITQISRCSNLQNLNVCLRRNLTGEHLDKLNNIKYLNLAYCVRLQPKFFKNLCSKTKLVSLDIEGCRRLDRSSIETLASTQTQLETLSINCMSERYLLPLATMKNLKRLRIDYSNGGCDCLLQELAKHELHGAELEVLQLINCLFNERVERAICSLKTLKVLAVDSCTNMTSMFFTELATTPLECFLTVLPELTFEGEGILNLIDKSETIKVIAIDSFNFTNLDAPSLVRSAYDIMITQKRTYPLSLLTMGPCIIEGILDERPILIPSDEFWGKVKKIGHLGSLPEYIEFNIYS